MHSDKINPDNRLEYVLTELDSLRAQNSRLRKKIRNLEALTSLKRFRFCLKLGEFYDKLFPQESIQRKALKLPIAPLVLIRRIKRKKCLRSLQDLISGHKRVYVIRTISWDDKLRQRPHHLAPRIASDDTFVIYLDTSKKEKARFVSVSKDFVVTSSLGLVLDIEKSDDISYYFQFSSTIPISLDLLSHVKKKGYKLIYEYIDEIDEKIFSDHTDALLDVWQSIKDIEPVFILASAQKLYEDAKAVYYPEKVFLSKNAVVVEDFDYHNFENAPVPSDLKSILATQKPIVGYYGAISPWLDYKMINAAMKELKEMEFVFIGTDYLGGLKHLDTKLLNVHYLGSKQYNKLPLYSNHFDCAIIPFKEGDVAKATSPVKLFEYMAMGIPTVCTKDLIECYGFDNVLIAKSQKEFNHSIKKAVKARRIPANKEKLLTDANNNSWQSRADDITRILQQLEEGSM